MKKVCYIQNKSGRAYIPGDVSKGFISSHSIGNDKWIFTRDKGVNGYVTPRE
jgi:hypothetical protein